VECLKACGIINDVQSKSYELYNEMASPQTSIRDRGFVRTDCDLHSNRANGVNFFEVVQRISS
jgi:hypothetical protein